MKISEKEKAVAKRPLKIAKSEKPILKATPTTKSRKKTLNKLFLYIFLFIKSNINKKVIKALILGNLKTPTSCAYSVEEEYSSTRLDMLIKISINTNLAIIINIIRIITEHHLNPLKDNDKNFKMRLKKIPIITISKAVWWKDSAKSVRNKNFIENLLSLDIKTAKAYNANGVEKPCRICVNCCNKKYPEER